MSEYAIIGKASAGVDNQFLKFNFKLIPIGIFVRLFCGRSRPRSFTTVNYWHFIAEFPCFVSGMGPNVSILFAFSQFSFQFRPKSKCKQVIPFTVYAKYKSKFFFANNDLYRASTFWDEIFCNKIYKSKTFKGQFIKYKFDNILFCLLKLKK